VLYGTLLLSALVVVALTAGAQANHSSLELLSQGTIGGTDPYISYYPVGGSSLDGTHAFFETDEKLLPSDTDNSFDVYQRFGGTTTRESLGAIGGNDDPVDVFFDATSDDGSHVFFETDEKLQSADNDTQFDIYDRTGGSTTYVTDGAGGSRGDGNYDVFFNGISSDGSKVFFTTAEDLVASDTDNCGGDGCDDVYERSGGVTTLVSAGGNGAFHATFVGGSSDGSTVFFETEEQLSGSDTDSKIDVYQRSGGTTTLVSTGSPGNGAYDSFFEGASSDGSKVFFSTGESLSGSDTDDCDPGAPVLGCTDIYQRSGGSTTLVSTGSPGNAAFNATYDANSTDGAKVFFHTRESLVAGDTDSQTDVYERSSGSTTQISTGSTGGNGAFASTFEGASSDGSRVFFSTTEKLENPPDTDSGSDVYQRLSGATTLVSIGTTGGNAGTPAFFDGNSLDGTRVFFSTAEKLENPPDTDSSTDVYERFSGVSLISIGPSGGNGAVSAFYDGASGDGSHVFFSTSEKLTNPPDTDSSTDVYNAGTAVGVARPKAATPTIVRLVPAFDQCTSPNASHGGPLNVGSCSPPAESSDYLTLGAPDVTGTAPSGVGSVAFHILGESPINTYNGDQADVQLDFNLSDVRTNVTPYPDYTGELRAVLSLRITDRYNGPTLTAPATASDLNIPFNVTCAATVGTEGSNCNLSTTVDGLTAGTVRENNRAVWGSGQVQVFDGGLDSDADTTGDNTLFMVQGTFAP
jgi:hypothetical protein